MTPTTSASPIPKRRGPDADDGFPALLASVQAHFDAATVDGAALFGTAVPDLYAIFLENLPQGERQYYTCRACQGFLWDYGHLVLIDPTGKASSALWNPATAPERFLPAVQAMALAVGKAAVEDVLLSGDPIWGRPLTGPWSHFSVKRPVAHCYRTTALKTAGQAMAEKRQDFELLLSGILEFPIEAVRLANAYLASERLYRSEKCQGMSKWLLELAALRLATANGRERENLIWRAVATAPAGFCHFRNGMLGSLLEDIVAKLPFEQLAAKFAAKMDPLQYQRPTAPPSDGNIDRAERVIEALNAANSLKRRFARIADIQTLWLQPAPSASAGSDGLFGHLRNAAGPKQVTELPSIKVTWDKFFRTVLPTAEHIEYFAPFTRHPFAALVTAVDPDAPPILQWDSAAQRNAVSWYMYQHGSFPQNWNLTPGHFTQVAAVTLQPNMWNPSRAFANQTSGVMFVLKNARDLRHQAGGGLFIEDLKHEFHEIRGTIEAHIKSSPIAERDQAEACGVLLQKGGTWDCFLRVTANGTRAGYVLDRWD